MIPICAVLSAEQTIVANRIYKDLAPEQVEYPYVTWFVVGGDPMNDKDEPASVDRVFIQVNCYGKSESESYAAYKAVRSVLKKYCNITGFVNVGIPRQGSRCEGFEAIWLVDSD